MNDPLLTALTGGSPLPGCPVSLDDARKWMEKANSDKDKWTEPLWCWDCGFKLDFDGPILRVLGRFYPPKVAYGPTWNGTVTFSIGDNEIIEKHFDKPSLDELKIDVENYVNEMRIKLLNVITTAIKSMEEGER